MRSNDRAVLAHKQLRQIYGERNDDTCEACAHFTDGGRGTTLDPRFVRCDLTVRGGYRMMWIGVWRACGKFQRRESEANQG